MRSQHSKIVFIYFFTLVLETICGFAHISLFSEQSYAQVDTVYIGDALQVHFAKGGWYCKNVYNAGGVFEHPEYPKLMLFIETGKVQVWKMSMDSLIRSHLEPDRSDHLAKMLYTKNGYNIIEKKPVSISAKDTIYNTQSIYQVFKYNDGYFVKFEMIGPYGSKYKLDNLLSEIMNALYLYTPEELDSKEGMPLNGLNIDQYVTNQEHKAIVKTARIYGQSYLSDEVKKSIHNDVQSTAENKMRWHCTHKEYFEKHRVIAGGHLSMDSWLDSKFGNGNPSEIEYCKACDEEGQDPWFESGFDMVVDCFMRHECRIGKAEETKWVSSKTFDISGKEHHWAIVISYKNINSPAAVFIFKFTKENDKWSFVKSEFDERHTKDLYSANKPNDIDILLSTIPRKGMSEMIEVKNATRNIYYMGNSNVPQTNYIRVDLSDRDTLKYNVEYSDIMVNEPFAPIDVSDNGNAIITEEVINDREGAAPTSGIHFYSSVVHYNSYTDNIYEPRNVVKDSLLMKRIEKVPGVYYEDKSLAGNIYTYVNEDTAYAAAMNLLKRQIAPAKRLYKTAMIYGDVNGNGRLDCYTVSISNGKLLSLRMLETTDTGIAELKADATVMKKISSTLLYKKLVEISLRSVNEEGDFVR